MKDTETDSGLRHFLQKQWQDFLTLYFFISSCVFLAQGSLVLPVAGAPAVTARVSIGALSRGEGGRAVASTPAMPSLLSPEDLLLAGVVGGIRGLSPVRLCV